ncbi:hypothetical protein PGT21_022707 [Puccinia graminis f. sp. tritici]|uniref:RRM domain-containing protein n=1 Tax=Puccinia graminis f. sp. tritici TaxID=56615 RepID=A0A5B0Q3H3_PUCGR|nr:hypothetical protein PGT21_022707 [Puccinia graminis f. sp. tritici]
MKQEDAALGLGEDDLRLPVREFSFVSQETIDRLNASNESWNQFVQAFYHPQVGDIQFEMEATPPAPQYFHAILPWPVELSNLSPGTTAADLRTALASYGDITHSFLLVSKTTNLGAIVHFSDHRTAAAAAADLDGTCADGFILQARLMSHKEQFHLLCVSLLPPLHMQIWGWLKVKKS